MQATPRSDECPIELSKPQLLEAGGDGDLELGEFDLELISAGYGISSLMFESLGAAIVDSNYLEQTIIDGREARSRLFGSNAHYKAAPRKLKGAEDVHVVQLQLGPQGFSDTHAHPGDEFLFVRSGVVELHLKNSGLSARLGTHSYIHFHSEQVHQLVNVSEEPADLFIVRFYQFENSGVRFRTLRELKGGSPPKNLVRRVIDQMRAVLSYDMKGNHGAANVVVDRFGFGRLLQMVSGEEFRGKGNRLTFSALAKQGLSKPKMGRLHQGLAPVHEHEIATLAAIHQAAPLLFYDYLFPALMGAVAIHHPADWESIPSEWLHGSTATYHVPSRHLAESDVSVAMIELEPGSETPVNSHPGFELILPIEGRVEVRLAEDDSRAVDAQEQLYVHFASSAPHSIANSGVDQARFLTIRFYQ